MQLCAVFDPYIHKESIIIHLYISFVGAEMNNVYISFVLKLHKRMRKHCFFMWFGILTKTCTRCIIFTLLRINIHYEV